MSQQSLKSLILAAGILAALAPAFATAQVIVPAQTPAETMGTLSYPAQNDTSSVMQPVHVGDVTFITGGVGDEERNELNAVKGDYNLHVMSASKTGAFVGDTQLAILDHNGAQILTTAAGPLFYAKLLPGRYTVEASSGGVTKKQSVTIGKSKEAHIHLSW